MRENLLGMMYGRLTVVSYVGMVSKGLLPARSTWLCRCECGKEKAMSGNALKRNKYKSCGCQNSPEHVGARMRKHGKRNSPEYHSWNSMIRRCTHPQRDHYSYYGGRGIKVCDRWLTSIDNFIADMGPRPARGMSIERNDPDGDYEPKNCRWATAKEQRANHRKRQATRLH